MEKLKLNLDDLMVESFQTAETAEHVLGTVEGYGGTSPKYAENSNCVSSPGAGCMCGVMIVNPIKLSRDASDLKCCGSVAIAVSTTGKITADCDAGLMWNGKIDIGIGIY